MRARSMWEGVLRVAWDGIYKRMRRLKAVFLAPEHGARGYLVRGTLAALLGTAMLLGALLTLQATVPEANANALRVSPTASCSQLARLDPTITNGSSWGRTILPGHGAPGGWFGVDVCSNGYNSVSPSGSSVSCDSTAKGCSPTTDGYGWTFQCPELVVRFSAWAFGDNPADWGRSGLGNAPDLWLPVNHPSDFVMYPNGSSTAPVPGDILVWGSLDANGHPWPAGPDGSHGGHIAVVAAVKGGKVITAEQNVMWGSEDHPSDTLALTKVGSRWILSGSARPATTLPTFRWLSTMGHSRGTFGWLHNVKNNGHFPSTSAKASTTPKPTTSKTVQQQFPGGLPSLASATVVTQSGTLADLTWSNKSFFAPSASADQPQAQVRSLGIPPGNVRLASGQSAATVLMSNGARYIYVLGMDGNLYLAHTSPNSLGVFWSALGQPSDVSLTGSPVASLFAGGVQIAALGSDGNLWWRAGPADRPGNWLSLGKPSSTTLAGSMALAGEPGAGTPIVFALGADGRIYMRIWLDATTAADGTQIPASWSDWMSLGAQPAGHQITGSLMVAPELPNAHNWIGLWPDSPLNLVATDNTGALWWFRSERLSNGWTASQVEGNPAPLSSLLGAVAVPMASTSTSSVSTDAMQIYASSRTASYMSTIMLPGAGKSAAGKPTWTALPDPPAGMSPFAQGAAVALGQGNSILVATAGDDVVLGGSQAMTDALLPALAAQNSTGSQSKALWARVGAVPAAATFSDSFTTAHPDVRWTRSDTSVRATFDAHGLTLIPGNQGVGALTQAASAGDSTLTLEVARPVTLTRSASVGMVLYQDDGDWLTLTVDNAGTVRFCPVVQQTAQTCTTGKTNPRAEVWLSIQRIGDTFTALVSNDDTSWERIGQWTPTLSGSAKAAQAPTATPHATATAQPTSTPTAAAGAAASDPTVAPLAFASWGVLAVGNGDAAGWPHIANFTVTSAP
ncbi:MAG TPA: CHAP domain-containing protein [Ktedonobacterales bacterium]